MELARVRWPGPSLELASETTVGPEYEVNQEKVIRGNGLLANLSDSFLLFTALMI
jgi:hypothetical protein